MSMSYHVIATRGQTTQLSDCVHPSSVAALRRVDGARRLEQEGDAAGTVDSPAPAGSVWVFAKPLLPQTLLRASPNPSNRCRMVRWHCLKEFGESHRFGPIPGRTCPSRP